MIHGGHSTLYVSDLDDSIRFYVEVLGLRLIDRRADLWATIDAGGGLHLGLHAATPAAPRPGTSGAITVGLFVQEPLEQVMARLRERGVWFRSGIVDAPPSRLAFFGDPDGNDLYLSETIAN
jgi:catechol 2,3-dioxygenase-like lactoylglutathione lyase family enzyme